VLHGIPVLSILDTAGALAARDIFLWTTHLTQNRDITDTRATLHNTIACAGTCTGVTSLMMPEVAGSSSTPATGPASPLAAISYHLMLPSCLGKKDTAVFEFTHDANENQNIKPVSLHDAYTLIDCLKNELNEKFMCELGEFAMSDYEYDPELYVEDDTRPYAGLRLVFVGGSHASRLATAAKDAGVDSVNLAVPCFKVTEQSINSIIPKLEGELRKCEKRCVVIFHLYDNNVFFSAREDGARSLPTKGKDDNVYHVPGKL
jgi:hypothetical protein